MVLKALSKNTIDIYAMSKPIKDSIQLIVWFDLGGAYLQSGMHPEAFQEAKKMIQDFGLSVSKAMIEDMLDSERKKLETLNSDLKDLAKDKKNYEDEILSLEKKIKEAKQKIEQNTQDQINKEMEIKTQTQIKRHPGQIKESRRPATRQECPH